MTRVVGILQARMRSTRLPGKVLCEVHGQPMLMHQVKRLQRSERLDALIIATSSHPSDDAIATLAGHHGLVAHRGSLTDVLGRFLEAASGHGADQIVRLTADCPLTDVSLVDDLIDLHLNGDYDYSCNFAPRRYPDGLDAEIFTSAALAAADANASCTSQREHVTPWMRDPATGLRCGALINPTDESALRWTVDYPEDLEFVRAVYDDLYPTNANFGRDAILAWLATDRGRAAMRLNADRREPA